MGVLGGDGGDMGVGSRVTIELKLGHEKALRELTASF